MKTLCVEKKIALLIPTIDTELAYFSANKNWYETHGVRLNISGPETIQLARDKFAFHNFLSANHFPTPRTGSAAECAAGGAKETASAPPLPVIFKPKDGSRSLGIFRANTAAEVDAILQNPPPDFAQKHIWQELWRGREFTINFFVGRDGHCRCAVPHERIEVRDGEVSKAATRRLPALEKTVREMAQTLPNAFGALCAQAIVRDDGSFALFELNARFGGGYPLADNAGAPFAQWLIEDALGLPSTINDNWAENRCMLRFDDAVFCEIPPRPER
ncbi:MAG: ATP-grasp domain-containing protein [Puniceicoccales bacterium]|nr:ATP-grasp domain-containing protein [Puniceicoccales bacterium]